MQVVQRLVPFSPFPLVAGALVVTQSFFSVPPPEGAVIGRLELGCTGRELANIVCFVEYTASLQLWDITFAVGCAAIAVLETSAVAKIVMLTVA
ncbi:MAG: hypothetical protein KME29_02795 [Calothrix sp. FI2-JRJ7]|nr:hypothetical protein [Calothrix sp. FI2-JRJ7]